MKRPSRLTSMLNTLAIVVTIVFGGYWFARRAESAPTPLATGTPPAAPAIASAIASRPAIAAAEPADAGAGDGGPPEPIDLAIAPDGGVPHHPKGTTYRSPFAKPDAASRPLADVTHQFLRLPGDETGANVPEGWMAVSADGVAGFVKIAETASPVGYRAIFQKTVNRWWLGAFVSGD